MKVWQRSLVVGALALAAAGAVQLSGYALPLAIGVSLVVLILSWALPRTAVRLLDEVVLAVRGVRWRGERHHRHAHGSLSLAVQDDRRHVWVDAADVRRHLHSRDRDDVLAARLAGRWKRDADGRVWLRADALVAHLAQGPSRLEPLTIRLRRHVQEQVLFPAEERRRRTRADGPGRR